jgi:hypothetical protein
MIEHVQLTEVPSHTLALIFSGVVSLRPGSLRVWYAQSIIGIAGPLALLKVVFGR